MPWSAPRGAWEMHSKLSGNKIYALVHLCQKWFVSLKQTADHACMFTLSLFKTLRFVQGLHWVYMFINNGVFPENTVVDIETQYKLGVNQGKLDVNLVQT